MKENEVLIVDDEKMVTDVTSAMVWRLFPGSGVDKVNDPDEAMRLLDRPYKVLIVDYNLKKDGCTGIEVMTVAMRKNPRIKVVMMTGYPDERHPSGMTAWEAARKAGCKILWQKPFNLNMMRATMAAWIV